MQNDSETPGARRRLNRRKAQSAKNGEATAGREARPSPDQARGPNPDAKRGREDTTRAGRATKRAAQRPAHAWQWGASKRKTRECSTLEERRKERIGGTHHGMANNVPNPRIGIVEKKTAPGHMRRRNPCQAGARGTRNQSACSLPRPDRIQRKVTSRCMKSCRSWVAAAKEDVRASRDEGAASRRRKAVARQVAEDQGSLRESWWNTRRQRCHSSGTAQTLAGCGAPQRREGTTTSSGQANSEKAPQDQPRSPGHEATPAIVAGRGSAAGASGASVARGQGRGTTGADRAAEAKAGPGARRCNSSSSSA